VAQQNISVGIDIGSTKVVVCIGKIEDNNTIDIIGVGESVNQGIRRGVIEDIDETVSAITAALVEAERMSGHTINNATVGISGPNIESEISKGVIAITRPDGMITEPDVSRVLDAAKAISNKPNRSLIHVIPLNFTIDGTEIVKNPIGMSGVRLETNTSMISASVNAIRSLERAITQAGIEPNDPVFSPLATAKVLLSKKQMEIGVILIDIGANTSSYVVYEESNLVKCGVIPIGSAHITNDIAIGLRTRLEIAELIKIKYGYAIPDKIGSEEQIDLSKLDKNETERVSLKYVSEIIEARLNEILLMVRDNLSNIDRDGTLPSGIVFTGGGAKIDGLVELAKNTMHLPAQIGYPQIEFSGLIDKLDDPVYATSMGLMLWGKDQSNGGGGSFNFDVPGLNGMVSKVKSIFKNFLP